MPELIQELHSISEQITIINACLGLLIGLSIGRTILGR
jgi:hypothetical protein